MTVGSVMTVGTAVSVLDGGVGSGRRSFARDKTNARVGGRGEGAGAASVDWLKKRQQGLLHFSRHCVCSGRICSSDPCVQLLSVASGPSWDIPAGFLLIRRQPCNMGTYWGITT